MRVNVKVQPRSGRQEIEKLSDTEYKIFLKKAPEDNKANIELLKLMKKYLKKEVRIVSGATSRNKIMEYAS